MLQTIPKPILDRMAELEKQNCCDRQNGTPTEKRLRQIPPETGRFIALLASMAPAGQYLEIGTSGGYSTLWLALACRATGKSITTFEILADKVELARETYNTAGVTDIVELIHGDALDVLPGYKNIAFCFLDAEKGIYQQCYDIIIPNLVPGGILVADNVISHESILKPMIQSALADERVDALVIPIGTGELVCRRT